MNEERDSGIPKDRGYAWIICIACMFEAFLFGGVAKSFGLFFVEYVIMFNASSSIVSAVVSVQAIIGCLTGLFVLTIGQSMFSIRTYSIFGAIVLCISYVINAFAPDIYVVLIGSGLVFGFGSAFIYTPATVIVGQYFEKRRGFANGVFKMGAGVASLCFPPFIRFIFDTYGVRGGLLIFAGMLLNIAPCGALLRPPNYYTNRKHRKKVPKPDKQIETGNSPDDPEVFSSLLESETTNEKSTTDEKEILNGVVDKNKRIRTVSDSRAVKYHRTFSTRSEHEPSSNHYHGDNMTNLSLKHVSISDIALYSSIDNVNSAIGNISIGEIKQDESRNPEGCCETIKTLNFKQVIGKIFDKKLLKNNLYRIYVPASCLSMIGFGLITTYIPPHAKDLGIDDKNIAILISIYGGLDLFGRFVTATLADRSFMKRSRVFTVAILCTGIVCQLLPLFKQFWSLAVFSGINGFFAGVYFSMYPLVLTDFIGIENLSSGLGMFSLCNGMGFLVATPLLGLIRDKTSSYLGSFHTMGSCLIAGGCILLLEPIIRKYQRSDDKTHGQELVIEMKESK